MRSVCEQFAMNKDFIYTFTCFLEVKIHKCVFHSPDGNQLQPERVTKIKLNLVSTLNTINFKFIILNTVKLLLPISIMQLLQQNKNNHFELFSLFISTFYISKCKYKMKCFKADTQQI